MAKFAKSSVPQFSVDVYQNEFLPEGGREVNAIVTVTSTGGGAVAAPQFYAAGRGADAAVALMVDCSGSMDYPPTKMRNARDATAAAIDALRDGVHFAVIGGTHVAKEVFPGNGRLAVADAQTRDQAKQALRKLSAGGGTAIGTWLRLADRLLWAADVPASSVRHGILLTDGRNEHESPEDLKAALDACAGRFTCDARGVGTDWEVKEVTGIASAMLGTADIVADPAGLAADFTRMMETAMGKEVADVALRLWTPLGAEIKFVKQVAPTVEELTDRRVEVGPRAGDYPTGSWGDESRDYHVCVQVPNAELGQEMLAGRVSLVIPGADGGAQTLGQGLVRAVWTDDMTASTSINPQVAHYTGQAELAQVIQQGLDARKAGDADGATAKLGRAVQLAAASGNADTAKLLSKVVDVVDAAEGTVRLKAKVAEADEMTLETRSTKTVRVKK
ncbi:vWA domain-containing protein [Streptomyces sp. NPDC001939]|uniref:vWA domain-containing protein n=1 Tax=unclassified Streptomyces TaxID=2593676 RepID=UPI002254D51E|nr:VWA domain-containing protein [Streptomyces sp. NBC_00401]MCX5081758.1 VWA domain-containing protein [Streptomyces sp. NBC_00401]